MATPTSRSTLKDYALRRLGFPVIDINVDDDQVDDRVDDALQKFGQYHYDANIPDYLAIKVDANTQTNAANVSSNASNVTIANNTYGWVPLPDNVIGVNRILPLTSDVVNSGSGTNFNIFDLNYQLRLNELYEFTSSSYQYYWIARTHIRMLELLLVGENPVRFNQHMGRVYIDMNWKAGEVPEDRYFILECTRVLTADEFPKVYNDQWLKEYTTQVIKKQWGENMKKYGNYTLPGGMIINGQLIYDEAIADILRLEEQLRDTYETPPTYLLG
jgi:hypothetical protein